jgi:hypothetical protein
LGDHVELVGFELSRVVRKFDCMLCMKKSASFVALVLLLLILCWTSGVVLLSTGAKIAQFGGQKMKVVKHKVVRCKQEMGNALEN